MSDRQTAASQESDAFEGLYALHDILQDSHDHSHAALLYDAIAGLKERLDRKRDQERYKKVQGRSIARRELQEAR